MTTYDVGRRFDEQVGKWLKKEFHEYEPEVAIDQYARGLDAIRPCQVDVALRVKGGGVFGFFKDAHDIWIECRWKDKESVKRDEIARLVYNAQDVYRYACQMGGFYYDGLMVVCNQRFDADALSVAQHEDVACVVFDGKRVVYDTATDNWLTQPTWLKRRR